MDAGQTTTTEEPENMNENEEGLLGVGPYDADDEEADRIYAAVDAKMDERRKARREAREREEAAKNKLLKPKIQEQFMDLKRALATVDEDAWASIPEAGDLTAVGKKMRKLREKERERFTATPDTVMDMARSRAQMVTQLDAQPGLATPLAGTETPMADFRQISKARDDMLKVKLDQACHLCAMIY
jgi:pre-mRNA-processing factor 6